MNPALAIVINTYNEKDNIQECIDSAKLLSNNIVIIDMESTDNTRKIAESAGCKVYNFPYTQYVEPARTYGIDKTDATWVFILDADERITPELSEEIQKVIQNTHYSYFKVPRKELYAKKKWLRHGGWWPNHQIRLINKASFIEWPEQIHGTPKIDGKMEYLQNPLIHFSKNDYAHTVEKTMIFEDIESDLLFRADRPVGTLVFFRKFVGELYKRMFLKVGFLDGDIGIIESIYQAFSKTITYLYLYEKKKVRSL